jgi:two-component system cell cycle sensor histidine kinase/response regulator CckA
MHTPQMQTSAPGAASDFQEMFERLTKIASQVPGVVYQYQLRPDGTSCFPYASDRIREIFRVTPEAVRDDASPVLACLHPDNRDYVLDSIQQSALSLSPWKCEFRMLFDNGDIRWLYGNSVPEKQQDGCVLWHGFITDVTEARENEDARKQLEADLRQAQKVESIGRLAGGVAHDFNNLLTTVMGFSELALSEVPAGSKAASKISRVIETAHRGAALTHQLLAFARKKIVKPESVNLCEVVTKLAPMIERLLEADIELALNLSPHDGAALVDVGGLEQVLVNLVVNARHAMPLGGRLTIAAQETSLDEHYVKTHTEVKPGAYVMLSVTDTGCGMTPEIMARLFEPFFTTKPPGKGTGLGLAMCYGIVRQAGGHIRVSSEPDKGSVFTVYLPRTQPVKSTREVCDTSVVPTKARETIMVVEDEPGILSLACDILVGSGYRVIAACNGMEALELLKQTTDKVDLVVTDLMMPKMGGRELAEKIWQTRPQVKMLYTSGYSQDSLLSKNGQHGMHFLPKPYTPSLLRKKVKEALEPAVAGASVQPPIFRRQPLAGRGDRDLSH